MSSRTPTMLPAVLSVIARLDDCDGGVTRAVLDIAAGLARNGMRSAILTTGAYRLPTDERSRPVVYTSQVTLGQTYRFSRPVLAELRLRIPQYSVAILHGAWNFPTWAAATVCQRYSVPYIYVPHGMAEHWATHDQGWLMLLKKRVYWLLMERAIARGARAIVFTTQRERLGSPWLTELATASAILPPVAADPPDKRCEDPETPSLRLPQGKKVALFLGRLHPKKNPDMLIAAWGLARLGPDWILVFAGTGEPNYVARLKRMAGPQLADGRILFVGHVSGADKAYLYQRADWFLLPSRQENFGIAVLEAVQNGCAVAVSDHVYIADHFPSVSEILPNQVNAWVTFMSERMVSEEWRNRVRQTCRANMLAEFSTANVSKRWTELAINAARPLDLQLPPILAGSPR